MTDQQMELSFGNTSGACATTLNRRQQRLNRAPWWFDRIRQIVDRAFDWQPAPLPRPEQIWLPEPKQNTRAEEQQICE